MRHEARFDLVSAMPQREAQTRPREVSALQQADAVVVAR